ncbi:MAG: hypothetical protein ACM31G_06610 [Flavobacteriales bacterium]
MEVSISDMQKACPKSTNPIRTGVSKENKLKKTGTGTIFLVSLKSDIKKGKAFSITVGSPRNRA